MKRLPFRYRSAKLVAIALRRWWLIGLSGLASLAAPEAATPPQFRVWLHLETWDCLDSAALAGSMGLTTDELTRRVQQAGKAGQALIWTGAQELAEWYAERLRAYGAEVTVAYQLSRWE